MNIIININICIMAVCDVSNCILLRYVLLAFNKRRENETIAATYGFNPSLEIYKVKHSR